MSHYTGSVPDMVRSVDWREVAACRKEDPELFFPVGNNAPATAQTREAKAVCYRCPVIEECLRWALATGQDTGVWGGLSEHERSKLKRRTRPAPDKQAETPTPPPARQIDQAAFQRVRNANSQPRGNGHLVWTGNRGHSVAGRSYTARQISFAADRGRLPDGRVNTECGVPGCVQHISDETERAADRLAGAGAGA